MRATGSVHRGRSAASSSPEATSDVAPERRAFPHLVARTVLGPAPRREARGGAGGGGSGAVAIAGPAVLVVGGVAVASVVPVDPRRVRHADDVRAAAGREAMAADQREDRVAQLRAAEGCAVKRAAARCAQRRSRVGRGARTRRASFAAWGGRVVVVRFCWSPHARVAASAAAEADGRRATPTHPMGGVCAFAFAKRHARNKTQPQTRLTRLEHARERRAQPGVGRGREPWPRERTRRVAACFERPRHDYHVVAAVAPAERREPREPAQQRGRVTVTRAGRRVVPFGGGRCREK